MVWVVGVDAAGAAVLEQLPTGYGSVAAFKSYVSALPLVLLYIFDSLFLLELAGGFPHNCCALLFLWPGLGTVAGHSSRIWRFCYNSGEGAVVLINSLWCVIIS